MPGTEQTNDTPTSTPQASETTAVPESGTPVIQSEGEATAADPSAATSQPDEGEGLVWSTSLKEGQPLTADLLKQIASLEKKHGVPHKAFTEKNMQAAERIRSLETERETLAQQYEEAQQFRTEALPILQAIANNDELRAAVEQLMAGQPQEQPQAPALSRDDIGRTVEEKLAQREERATHDKFIEDHPVLDEDSGDYDGLLREQFDTFIQGYAQHGIVTAKQIKAAYDLAEKKVNELRGTSGTSSAAQAAQRAAGALPAGKARTGSVKTALDAELSDFGRLSPYTIPRG